MKYELTMSESGDWYIVPLGKAKEFYELELDTGSTPAWAKYIQDPESIVIEKWEMK